MISVQERGWRWSWGRRGAVGSKFEYNDIKSSRLSGSAVLLRRAFPFLSKAARHSSGFNKSSADETNPVASLCESCRQTTPPAPPQAASSRPLPSPRPPAQTWVGWGWGWGCSKSGCSVSGGAFGDWFQFNTETYKRKNQFKVAGSPGSPGRVSIGNAGRERWGAGGCR